METRVQLARHRDRLARYSASHILDSIPLFIPPSLPAWKPARRAMIDSYADLIANCYPSNGSRKMGKRWRESRGERKIRKQEKEKGVYIYEQVLIWGNGIKLMQSFFENILRDYYYLSQRQSEIWNAWLNNGLVTPPRNSARNDFSPFYASISNALVSTSCIS